MAKERCGIVNEVRGAPRQHQKPFFRCGEIAGQKLALGLLELERERKRVLPFPTVLSQQLASSDKICHCGGNRLEPPPRFLSRELRDQRLRADDEFKLGNQVDDQLLFEESPLLATMDAFRMIEPPSGISGSAFRTQPVPDHDAP